MLEWNPYQAPMSVANGGFDERRTQLRRAVRILSKWLVAYLLNMIVPLYFGWLATEEHGRIGMLAAVVLLFAASGGALLRRRELAGPSIIGAAVIAVTALFPLLQIIAGLIGLGVGQLLGLAVSGGDDGPPQVFNELGGFIVTPVTGGILMVLAAGCGLLARSLTPDSWWRRPRTACAT